jgi:hypothetical protein
MFNPGLPRQNGGMSQILPPNGRKRTHDPESRVALMLCESLIHLLVEKGVLGKAEVCQTIEGLEEITREMTDRQDTAEMGRAMLAVLLPIRQSLEASS